MLTGWKGLGVNRVEEVDSVAEDFTLYADDPVGFVTDVLGDAGKPYSKQAKMLEAVVEHRRVSVVGANSSGKDWTAARAVLWWLETRPDSKALVTGPTQRQVEEIVWQEMREAYAEAEDRLSGRMLKSAYRIDEKRFALGFSTNMACNIQGFHSPNLLVVVTEAHAMPQSQMDAIKRLHPNRLLLVGNAMSLDGEFYESHHSRRARYHRIKISAYDTPNFTGENGGLPGTVTPEDVEELALDWSEDHPSYASAVLAEFPDAQEDSLVGREAVEAAMARSDSVVPAEAGTAQPWAGALDAKLPVYVGVDVARFGFDKSAICVRQGAACAGPAFVRADGHDAPGPRSAPYRYEDLGCRGGLRGRGRRRRGRGRPAARDSARRSTASISGAARPTAPASSTCAPSSSGSCGCC